MKSFGANVKCQGSPTTSLATRMNSSLSSPLLSVRRPIFQSRYTDRILSRSAYPCSLSSMSLESRFGNEIALKSRTTREGDTTVVREPLSASSSILCSDTIASDSGGPREEGRMLRLPFSRGVMDLSRSANVFGDRGPRLSCLSRTLGSGLGIGRGC